MQRFIKVRQKWKKSTKLNGFSSSFLIRGNEVVASSSNLTILHPLLFADFREELMKLSSIFLNPGREG